MVVAVPASERRVDSKVDDRFARCPFFVYIMWKRAGQNLRKTV
jgi:predicted Fe-Mo cluster-binding NifX family protein